MNKPEFKSGTKTCVYFKRLKHNIEEQHLNWRLTLTVIMYLADNKLTGYTADAVILVDNYIL